MKETAKKIEFYNEFMEKVHNKGIKSGSNQNALFNEMLTYMEQPEEPEIFEIPYANTAKSIALNGYVYNDEEKTLSLYIVDYSYEFIDADNQKELETVSMTELSNVANKAKRFYTNAAFLLDIIDKSQKQLIDLASTILQEKGNIEEIIIYVLTNRFYLANKLIDLKIPGIDEVNVQVWDMDRVYQLTMAEQGIEEFYIDLEKDYEYGLEMIQVPNAKQDQNTLSFDCYIGYIPAALLARLYEDWGPKLVERNVRSFLQARGGTNRGIRDTLKDEEQKQYFVAYNNGISSVARFGDIEKVDGQNLYKIKGLTGWQIVNGGQTTASIYQAYKDGIDLSDVYIQAKLTIINTEASIAEKDRHVLEDEMVSKISEYANTQNKINKSDLLANTRFMSDIEKFSRNTWIPALDGRKAEKKWYFERARGQYMVDINRRKRGKEQNEFKKQYPKEHVLTKVDIAKHFMSWEGHPHISSKGGEEAFKKFMNFNSKYWKYEKDGNGELVTNSLNVEEYKKLIARSIINQNITRVIDELKLKGYRANVIYYTTAMFNYVYGSKVDLLEVWNHQSLSDKWNPIIQTIAGLTLNYLKESAGDRNVTQWAKQETCWLEFKKSYSKQVGNLV